MYDLVVIGGVPAGLKVARAAARVGAKVAQVEMHCVGGEEVSAAAPSKRLVQVAKLVRQVKDLERFGLRSGPLQVDLSAVMRHVTPTHPRHSGQATLRPTDTDSKP
jgi:pyruvate/2-oxoglutarate dehydrogenase complex dihydrolipoamide dehydrogenase (E3) component